MLFYSPGSLEATYITETIMEHVAYRLGKDPTDVKRLNLYKSGEVILQLLISYQKRFSTVGFNRPKKSF